MEVNTAQQPAAAQIAVPQQSRDVPVVPKPAPSQSNEIKIPVKSTNEVAKTEGSRLDAVRRAAQSFKDVFAVSDTTFTIFKDTSGQYVTRFTSLKDGSVQYFPEPEIMRALGKSAASLVALEA